MFRKLVDTNVLFDAWSDNSNTGKALDAIDEPICLLEGVLYELSNLLKNTQGTELSCQVVNEILKNPQIFKIIRVSTQDTLKALQIMKKYSASIPKKDYSLVDALQLVLTEKENFTLYTLDERMTYYNPKQVKVIKPY